MKWTHKECIAGCNDGNPIPRENFSKNQQIRKDSKCKDCIANRRGPVSSFVQKRKAGNDAAEVAKQNLKKVKEQLAEAVKSKSDEATISALEREVEIAGETAAVATEKSHNGKKKDYRKKSNAAAQVAKQRAEEAEEQLAEAVKSGADDLKISALRKEKEAADADAEDKRLKSCNGQQNDRRANKIFCRAPSGEVIRERDVFAGLGPYLSGMELVSGKATSLTKEERKTGEELMSKFAKRLR